MSVPAVGETEHRARIGPFSFENRTTVETVEIAYWTLGRADPDGGNVVLLCHGASGDRDGALPYCRPGGAFDPERWFIVSFDAPGGGASSRPRVGSGFPVDYTIGDLANIASAMLTDLSIPRVSAFCGPSMAGLVGIELALRRPGLIDAMVLWTSGHRSDGYAATVSAAIALALRSPGKTPERFRAAATAFLPALLARSALAAMTAGERARMLDDMTERWAATWDPGELAARYSAIGRCDPLRDLDPAAVADRLDCPILWLEAASDQLFELEAMQRFAATLPRAEVRAIETSLGHLATAAAAGSPEQFFFKRETRQFLQRLDR